MNKLITDIQSLRQLPKCNGVPKVLFCYWSEGSMPEARKLSLDYLLTYAGMPVILVDKKSFLTLTSEESPIHPAFNYLSAVHQSDYVRTYLWHYWGGGWHDIKASKVDLSAAWNDFADPGVYFVGRPEHPNGPARIYDKDRRWMPNYWKDLVSVIAWIGRPKTKFSEAMLLEMHAYLDDNYAALKKNPGRHPREKKIQSKTLLGRAAKSIYRLLQGRDIHYPIPWTLFGNLFHPLNLIFKDHVSRNLPVDAIKNAGIYHRSK